MRAPSRLAISTLLLALCASAAGCSRPSSESDGRLHVGPLPRITSESQYTYPMDAYLPSTGQQDAYLAVFRQLVRRCVESYGLAYAPVGRSIRSAYLWDPNQGQFPLYNNGAGVVSEDRAARYGYKEPGEHMPTTVTGAPPAPPPVVLLAVNGSRSAKERASLHDSTGHPLPIQGCYGVASDRLGGQGPVLPDVTAGYKVSVASTGSRIFADALTRWVRCMRGHGRSDATTPQNYGFQFGLPGAPTVSDTRLALLDVACKRTSRVADAYVAVRRAHETAFIRDHQAAFEEFRAWAAKVTRAVGSARDSTP